MNEYLNEQVAVSLCYSQKSNVYKKDKESLEMEYYYLIGIIVAIVAGVCFSLMKDDKK
ncbi:hypothetical protein MUA27_05790 [Mammaliicoccus sciuri]|uniref:hypothetical protein n=1 Tax=Mammaliicoccus sciuri TaxID=1296 RepID=UPI0021D34C33|nr:hypothetical protein [Mammaliicoccus sciuri]UXU79123.1 hypothetical protein MUA27_05790 [Mammaliicoccus sciuri]